MTARTMPTAEQERRAIHDTAARAMLRNAPAGISAALSVTLRLRLPARWVVSETRKRWWLRRHATRLHHVRLSQRSATVTMRLILIDRKPAYKEANQ